MKIVLLSALWLLAQALIYLVCCGSVIAVLLLLLIL
jgi:hypothetical protein